VSEPSDAAIRDHLAASWPATTAEVRDGWLLRATPEVPRGRLNSALPLTRDPDLGAVTAFYAARGLPAQVQVTPLGGRPELAAALDAAGWGTRYPSTVLAGDAGLAPPRTAVELRERLDDQWLAAWAAAEGRDEADARAHADAVLAQLDGRAAYALAGDGDAVGLAVAGDGLCGLFCIATRPDRRRGGLGTGVVAALAGWGRERGAHSVCLEVEQRNAPALALYARLGLTRRYDYVHRVSPTASH
jgi:ribosomal protein S18 acetylase RimI-like enzyme